MSKTARGFLFTIGYVAVGLIAVGAVGCLTYHRQFFHFPEPMLSLLLLGLMGALIYASVQMRGAGFAVLAITLSFVARVALSPRSYSLVAAVTYTLLIGFSLMAAAYVQKSLTGFRFGRFISMGLIVGAGYALMTLLFAGMWNTQTGLSSVWSQTFLGAKLGAAMGLGFELIDLIGPRPKKGSSRIHVGSLMG
ncbi:MAG: hypothetical protein NTX53_05725 [candidate division WOR-3 bacterium]|nr:hypothetical protein [candidate division WOR-3 bacterium]